ncbi:MAG: hypothetical protein KAX66_00590 [Propionivibrio sp.]|nr:hypothetical protein [Propionivibrio sp.]
MAEHHHPPAEQTREDNDPENQQPPAEQPRTGRQNRHDQEQRARLKPSFRLDERLPEDEKADVYKPAHQAHRRVRAGEHR